MQDYTAEQLLKVLENIRDSMLYDTEQTRVRYVVIETVNEYRKALGEPPIEFLACDAQGCGNPATRRIENAIGSVIVCEEHFSLDVEKMRTLFPVSVLIEEYTRS